MKQGASAAKAMNLATEHLSLSSAITELKEDTIYASFPMGEEQELQVTLDRFNRSFQSKCFAL